MRTWTGPLLIAIGLLHTVFGVTHYRRELAETWHAGFFNALAPALARKLAFWFLFSGFLLIVLGHLCLWLEKGLGRPVPAFVGWELLVLSLVGAALMPVSGFWLVIAAAIYSIIVA